MASPGTAWTDYQADNFGPSQQYVSAGAFGYGDQEGRHSTSAYKSVKT